MSKEQAIKVRLLKEEEEELKGKYKDIVNNKELTDEQLNEAVGGAAQLGTTWACDFVPDKQTFKTYLMYTYKQCPDFKYICNDVDDTAYQGSRTCPWCKHLQYL